MQFKVPQDVQRPDTIIGPITIKQLIILGIGGAIGYFIFVSLAETYFIEIWLPPVIVVGALTLAFAFLKINNREFHIFLMNLISFHLLAKKRKWIQNTDRPIVFETPKKIDKNKEQQLSPLGQKEEKIADLSSALENLNNKSIEERAKELHDKQ